MFLSSLKHVALSLIGSVLVCGALLYPHAKSGQPGQYGQPPQAPPGHKEAEPRGPTDKRTEVPAPRELKVAAGRGKILMYALDDKGQRVLEQPGGPYKETEVEMRWTVITGVLDHRKVQEWASEGVRVPLAPGDYIYRRVDLVRQVLEKDGTWSAWKPVDLMANLRILDNVPEVEEERTPDEVRGRPHYLVDPLPHLTIGHWRGVDVEDFVPPREKGRRRSAVIARPGHRHGASSKLPAPEPRS